MGIESEVEKILEKKGVTPPGMTREQFIEEFQKRAFAVLPGVIENAVNRINRDIAGEEMVRIGRGEPCRFVLEKSQKHCTQPPGCHDCPNYRPMARWRRWLGSGELPEIAIIAFAAATLALALLQPEVGFFVLCVWCAVVVVSRLHIRVLNKHIKWLHKKM